jgi:hypothetical protein
VSAERPSEQDEQIRRDEGDDYEDRDSDLPVEPTAPREDPDPEEVPPGTEPGADQ